MPHTISKTRKYTSGRGKKLGVRKKTPSKTPYSRTATYGGKLPKPLVKKYSRGMRKK